MYKKIILILVFSFLTISGFAAESNLNKDNISIDTQKNIELFLEKSFKKVPVSFDGFAILSMNKVPTTKWTEYLIIIKVIPNKVRKTGEYDQGLSEPIEVAQILFSDGFFVVGDIYDPNEDKFLSEIYKPVPGHETTIENRLIYGKISAPNQILVYADPLCKFCREEIPSLLSLLKTEKSEDFSVFLVSLPLKRIHSTSITLVKIIALELSRGNKEIIDDLYKIEIPNMLYDENKILSIVNKELSRQYTKEEINTENILNYIEKDRKNATSFMVNSTPTVFLNGVITRDIIRDVEDKLF